MLYFHSAARRCAPMFIAKGQSPWTEMYGVIRAEYDPTGFVNTAILDAVEQSDEVYIAGEASSHCVLASIAQIAEHFADHPDITRRLVLLDDCASPIPSFEEETNKAFAVLQEKYGIRIMKSTETK
jgi:nicotinamidase-related amidase